MPFMDGQSLVTILGVLIGVGIFLRMVAKEKRRREKHLEYRLYEKMRIDAEQKRFAENQAASGAGQTPQTVLTVVPVAEVA